MGAGYEGLPGHAGNFSIAYPSVYPVRFVPAPRDTFKGAGDSRKAVAGTGEAICRGHFFFWHHRRLDPGLTAITGPGAETSPGRGRVGQQEGEREEGEPQKDRDGSHE